MVSDRNKSDGIKLGYNCDWFFDRYGLFVLLFLILAIGIYAYREYLFFDKVYVSSLFCSDTICQFFPEYYFRSARIYSGDFSFWSFQFDLGMNIFGLIANFNPFDILLLSFGKENFAYVLPYIVMLKLVVVGLFFYGFLRQLKISAYVAIIGSLLFTYSGYMVLNGHWYHYQNYAVFVTLMLFLFERWFQHGRWLWLVLALGLVCLKGVLQLYQLVFFFSIYSLFRIALEYDLKSKEIALFFIKAGFLFVIGIGISSFFILPETFHIMNSARGGGALEKFSIINHIPHFFRISSLSDYATAFFRFFSSDLLGSWQHFRGLGNYLESPADYVGLISLIVIPFLFVRGTRREKIAFSLLVVTCIIYFVFPFVREFGNAFASGTYKHTIMYISLILIILASYSLNFILRESIERENIIFISIAFIIAILFASGLSLGLARASHLLDKEVFFKIIVFLLIYGFCFFLLFHTRFKQTMKFIILIIIVVELALFSRTTIARISGSLEPGFIERGDFYFNKSQLKALEYIKSIDNGFYRIEKDSILLDLNAPLVQGYYGTSAYLGFCNPGIVDFHKTMRLSRQSPRLASYRYGLGKRNRLHSLLSVKYYLSASKDDVPVGYVYLKSFGNIHVFKNKYNLPLGFAYKTYVDRGTFNSFSEEIKDAVILKSFVTDSNYSHFKKIGDQHVHSKQEVNLSEDDAITDNLRILSGSVFNNLKYISLNNDPQIIINLRDVQITNGLKLRVDLETERNSSGQLFWRGEKFSEDKSKKFVIKPGKHEYVIIIDERDISSVRLDIGNKAGEYFKINSIKIYNIETEKQTEKQTEQYIKLKCNDIVNDINELRQETFQLEQFQDDHIKGFINLESNGMVFFAIPYDKGWKVKVNGKSVEPVNINIAFMGIPLEKGFHNIELKFIPPLFYTGIIISIISLVFTLVMYLKMPVIKALRQSRRGIAEAL